MPLDSSRFIWRAQPGPQSALIACPVFEVFFGGARGGGKTDGMLGEFVVHADQYGANAIGLMVRRTLKQLRETMARSKQIYQPLGATFNETDKEWTFPNGARLIFAYLERDADADNYQGHSYTRVYVEEIGNFPNSAPIFKLMATLRSGAGVPCCFRATGNPGGAGHQWVKARYIDPAPAGWKIVRSEFKDPFTGQMVTRDRVYIPSRLTDNSYLGADYVANLHMVGSVELVRAWLEGDWNVIAGAFFPEFGPRHIIGARSLPEGWPRFRSGDWGSARPFSVGWWAISDGSMPDLPRGALVRYREWYGWNGNPNEGLKLTAEEVGSGIAERDADDKIVPGASVLDPAAFAQDGGPSIAERIYTGSKNRVLFRRADNKRVSQQGALGGWDQVRARLKGDGERPMIYFMENCTHAIRTLPALQHDEIRPEDVDCWVAGTLVSTPNGDAPIEDIMPGDIVDTPIGPRPVLRSYLSGASATVRLRLADGRYLEGTPHHKVYVRGRGLISLKDIECHDVLRQKNTWSKQLCIAVSLIAAIRGAATIIQTGLSSREAAQVCIARCGSMLAMRSRQAGTFITRTITTIIMPSTILSASHQTSMAATTTLSAWPVILGKDSRSGVALTRGLPHSGTMRERCEPAPRDANARALIAELLLKLDILASGIARLNAAIGGISLWNWLARSVGSRSAQSATRPSKPEHARIVAVGHCAKRTPVYNLTVADAHLFYANGFLSSNTEGEDHAPDEIRYACMSRPYLPANQPKPPPVFKDMRNMTVSELWESHERQGNRDLWR